MISEGGFGRERKTLRQLTVIDQVDHLPPLPPLAHRHVRSSSIYTPAQLPPRCHSQRSARNNNPLFTALVFRIRPTPGEPFGELETLFHDIMPAFRQIGCTGPRLLWQHIYRSSKRFLRRFTLISDPTCRSTRIMCHCW